MNTERLCKRCDKLTASEMDWHEGQEFCLSCGLVLGQLVDADTGQHLRKPDPYNPWDGTWKKEIEALMERTEEL